MSIPKCKECEYHWKYNIRWKGGRTKSGRGTHWCKKIIIHHEDRADSYTYITSMEFKTSPKWCPKRG